MLLTKKQKETLAQIVIENIGADMKIQSGKAGKDIVYIAYRFGPDLPVKFTYVNKEGEIINGSLV